MSLSESRNSGMAAIGNEIIAAFLAGAFSLSMLLGAWAFQYIGGLAPCEMCIWQRWPHAAPIWLGLGGAIAGSLRLLPREVVSGHVFEKPCQPLDSSDHSHGGHIGVRSLVAPLGQDVIDVVACHG